MKFKSILFTVLTLCSTSAIWSQPSVKSKDEGVILSFKDKKGTHSTILSTVEESVSIKESPRKPLKLNHKAVILNRVSAEVTDEANDGTTTTRCRFMTSENSVSTTSGSLFTYGQVYDSEFTRTPQGEMTMTDEYFMPTVINVPVFKTEPVKPGDTWSATGYELHDLRMLNMEKPFKVPFEASYTYYGEENGFHLIGVKYNMYMETPDYNLYADGINDFPVSISGLSDELIYFDNENGHIDHYTEKFTIIMNTYFGMSYKFDGTAHAEVTFTKPATEENVKEVKDKIENLGIENVTVKKDDVGLTLSIENIQFKAESAYLMDSEKEKLKKIAEILNAFPEKDILVTGHTALYGTPESCQSLSELRAQAVAGYLISLKVRDSKHIYTQGFGATKPIAPNNTSEGKAKNRRVEITLMDN